MRVWTPQSPTFAVKPRAENPARMRIGTTVVTNKSSTESTPTSSAANSTTHVDTVQGSSSEPAGETASNVDSRELNDQQRRNQDRTFSVAKVYLYDSDYSEDSKQLGTCFLESRSSHPCYSVPSRPGDSRHDILDQELRSSRSQNRPFHL
jgi:hypothetical protein